MPIAFTISSTCSPSSQVELVGELTVVQAPLNPPTNTFVIGTVEDMPVFE